MLFWIVSLALSAVTGAMLLRALLRGGGRDGGNADIKVYRDQLAEIDRDLARGVIDATEAERTRIEVSRRILEADRSGDGAEGGRGSPVFPVLAILAALGGGVGLYWTLGAPGFPDLPIAKRIARAEAFRAGRPSQAEAEVEAAAALATVERPKPDPAYLELMDRLRKAVDENPGDITGQRLLARNEAILGNYAAAVAAQTVAIDLAGADASANDYASLADNLILSAGGFISPQAETALTAALERNPHNGTARYYMGLMWAQTGRPDRAFPLWRDLLEEGPEQAPWIPPIREQIEFLAAAAGVDYTPPAPPDTASGPGAADFAAAAEMTPEERQGMIRGMVEGLAERLATDGGPAEDWARLITALGVLGEADRAGKVWDEAQVIFADRVDELSAIREAARKAGVAE